MPISQRLLSPISNTSMLLSRAHFAPVLILLLLLITACGTNAPTATLNSPQPSPQSMGEDVDASQQEIMATEAGTSGQALSAPISGVDPCELLTTPEVEAALGEPLAGFERSTVYSYESCNFESQSGGKFIILQLTHQNAEQFIKDNEETSAMFEVELLPIENLGDEAVYYSGLLRVRVGETVMQIATWHPEAEQEQALLMTQELARLALERLP